MLKQHLTDAQLADMNEVARLKQLLRAKAGEYEIFGRTTEDVIKDNEIRQKVKVLEQSLKL